MTATTKTKALTEAQRTGLCRVLAAQLSEQHYMGRGRGGLLDTTRRKLTEMGLLVSVKKAGSYYAADIISPEGVAALGIEALGVAREVLWERRRKEAASEAKTARDSAKAAYDQPDYARQGRDGALVRLKSALPSAYSPMSQEAVHVLVDEAFAARDAYKAAEAELSAIRATVVEPSVEDVEAFLAARPSEGV